MTSISIIVPIAVCALYLFTFYTSGSILIELFKFKIKNSFVAIATGFFTFFTFISICTFPLQLIPGLPYVFYIYYIFAISIIYLVFSFIFMRFWLNTNFFKLDALFYFFVLLIFLVINYFSYKYISNENFNRHKNALSILFWLKDNPVSFFDNSTLFNFLGFKPFQGWYSFQLSLLIMVGAETYQYQNMLVPFMLIIDAFLAASIFLTIMESLSNIKFVKNKAFLFFTSLVFFSATRIILWYYNYSIWEGQVIFIYLIFYSMIWILRYTTLNYRERYSTLFIGLVIGGYISFLWEGSYQVLFLIYTFLFTIQRRYNNNFTKDILKIGLFPLIDFLFYNIILQLYFQVILFGALLLFMFFVSYLMSKKYSAITKFELFLEQRSIFAILIVPIILIIISIAIALGLNQNFISEEYNTLNFLYIWYSFIKNEIARQWISFILSMIILALAFAWVIFRKNLRSNILTSAVDLTLISYLTFYNPIVMNFIRYIYSNMIVSNELAIISLVICLTNSLPFYIFNKIDNKKVNPLEIKIIKKYSRLKI
ncbi:hypothetical protein [Spiroplasma taiwanense]|uniref:Transmembrane protein n=1 Tax=Spiroplasma taiwanense CT-1 TaxID=1276220 RepID=S5LYS6_9MOLU|nr:hypothetical protein [Spiroplasma taiwanense]AGR40832.1 hypothetical protein STAIW_v1c01480 [Spiroplasma taiwanense CT-1]